MSHATEGSKSVLEIAQLGIATANLFLPGHVEWENAQSMDHGASGCTGPTAQFHVEWEQELVNDHVTHLRPPPAECFATGWSDKWTCALLENVR